MSAFFASQTYKPQIRQEGFHLPSPSPSNTTPPPGFESNHLFIPHNFLPDAFRKYPSPADSTTNSMDFTDELASLIANPPAGNHHQSSHERSTHSPTSSQPITSSNTSNPNPTTFDDAYRPPHGIFDVSSQNQQHPHPSHHHSSTSSSSSPFPPHYTLQSHSHRSDVPQSQSHIHSHQQQHPLHDFTSTHHAHFNAPLNTSVRYDTHPDHPLPPSSFQAHFRNNSPSPLSSRSRSRSRAPSLPPKSGGVGPTRTTRTRRNNSVSSTSPPPHASHPRSAVRPQAIIIPGSHRPNGPGSANGNGNGINGAAALNGNHVSPLTVHGLGGANNSWYMPSSAHSPEYSLPTPESLTHSHHSHSVSHPNFTPFGLSPTDTHLPPVSTLHSHSLSKHDDHLPQHSRTNSGAMPQAPSLVGVNGITAAAAAAAAAGTAIDKQAILASEKRRRRRESHNAVERRRRDNINEKISELATLIPECMLDPACPASAASLPSADDLLNGNLVEPKKEEGGDGADSNVVKANKGMILRKSVEYIRYLQQLVDVQANRNRELEQQLSAYRSSDKSMLPVDPTPPTQTHTPSSDSSGQGDVGDSCGRDLDKSEEMGMILHEEVGEGFGVGPFELSGMGAMGFNGGFGKGMFELESMPEGGEYMEVEDGEGGPSTDGLSPSIGSAEGSEEREEEERGRRGRDGRVRSTEISHGRMGVKTIEGIA